jgi:hypothetical protein
VDPRTNSGRLVAAQVFVAVAHFGCSATAPQRADQILEGAYSERPKALRTAPLEQQIPLYLELMLRTEPPDMRLAVVVAEAGPAVIPSILKALRTAKQDHEVADLGLVLTIMQRSGTYDVSENEELCVVLSSRARRMQDPIFRKMVTDDLDQTGCGDVEGKP